MRYSLFFLFITINLFSQHLPEIISPSPTVSGSMKVEEVPIGHYTGTPNITLPIYNIGLNKNLNLNISINYNSSGIRIDERSGWIGTGWNLNAGGSISRTVMDVPDEEFISSPGDYFSGSVGTFHNNFNYISNLGLTEITPNDSEQLEEFIWKTTNGIQHYDYQPDLFQFNFLGYSGRFIVINENGNLVPKIISSDNKLKINLFYNSNFEINSFEIIDPFGNKFLFEEKEITTSYSLKSGVTQNNDLIADSFGSPSPPKQHCSSWKITQIKSANNNLLASYTYHTVSENFITPSSTERAELLNPFTPAGLSGSLASYNASLMPPKRITTSNKLEIQSKKLNKIILRNNTEINFEINQNHPEYLSSGPSCTLATIKIANNNNVIKQFNFQYSTSLNNRLFLDKLVDKRENINLPYEFSYIKKNQLPSFGNDKKDKWGYFNGENNSLSYYYGRFSKNVDSIKIKTGVLSEIKYPTGGKKVFNYESNEIAYVGGKLVNVYKLPENRITKSSGQTFSGNVSEINQESPLPQKLFFYIDTPQRITLNYQTLNISNAINYEAHKLRLSKMSLINPNSFDPYATGMSYYPTSINEFENISLFTTYDLHNATQSITTTRLLDEGWYLFDVYTQSPYFISEIGSKILDVDLNIHYTTFKYNTRNLKGGGLRIKSIVHKDKNQEVLKTNFNYDLLEDDYSAVNPQSSRLKLSSGTFDGSILMSRSYYKKLDLYTPSDCMVVQGNSINNPSYLPTEYNFKISKTLNIIATQMTKGNYVGYKNVKEYKSGLGKTQMNFTSFLEYPSYAPIYYAVETPFYFEKPEKDYDYKRGLLLESTIYDESGKELKNVKNNYQFDELATYKYFFTHDRGFNCVYDMFYTTYYNFINGIANSEHPCGVDSTPNSSANCLPSNYIGFQPVYHTYGRSKLSQAISKDFFYDNQENQTATEIKKKYFYNTANFQVREEQSHFEEQGIETQYRTQYYHSLGSDFPPEYPTASTALRQRLRDLNKINEVLGVATFKNGVKLSQTNTIYDEQEPNMVLASLVDVAKGTDIPETRVKYTKYDSYGNILEVKKESGISISYVWGYNSMYPVAKIENADYAAIEALSNFGAGFTITEGLTISQEQGLRSLPNAQITTYTYKPLVGITSMTGPKGYTIYYGYDSFNRLEYVKDADGNILTKNEYNYANQN